jgi:hypothetical protein
MEIEQLRQCFLALTQLFYLHRGLKLCSTSVLYPFVFCIYNIIDLGELLFPERLDRRESPPVVTLAGSRSGHPG